MATLSTLLTLLSLWGCLLPVLTEQTKWGNVRPPRVLAINDTIYVHVVPHTHDDVGWLKTVDEYYYGGSLDILFDLVATLLSDSIQSLDSFRKI